MSNKKTITLLKEFTKKNGYIKAAQVLFHKDTARIQRWERDGKIPESHEVGVRAVLEKMGES